MIQKIKSIFQSKQIYNDVYGLAISPDERTLVGASSNGSMKKWNIIKPEEYIINQDGGIII